MPTRSPTAALWLGSRPPAPSTATPPTWTPSPLQGAVREPHPARCRTIRLHRYLPDLRVVRPHRRHRQAGRQTPQPLPGRARTDRGRSPAQAHTGLVEGCRCVRASALTKSTPFEPRPCETRADRLVGEVNVPGCLTHPGRREGCSPPSEVECPKALVQDEGGTSALVMICLILRRSMPYFSAR